MHESLLLLKFLGSLRRESSEGLDPLLFDFFGLCLQHQFGAGASGRDWHHLEAALFAIAYIVCRSGFKLDVLVNFDSI